MNEQDANSAPDMMSDRRRRWPWVISVLLLLTLVILVLLPYGIRYGVQRALLASGAEQAQISDIDFNPFAGLLEVDNLEVNVGGSRTLHIPNASVNISWWPLVKKRAVVQGIIINDTVITIEQKQLGDIQVGGLSLKQGEQPPPQQPASQPWDFAVTNLTIHNTEIHYKSPQLDARLQIDDMTLDNLESWSGNRPARLGFQGKINDAPLQVQADLALFSEVPGVKGYIELKELPLESFGQFVEPHLSKLAGRISIEINVEVMQQTDALNISQQGAVVVAGLHAGTEFGEIDDERLDWNGAVDIALVQNEAPHVNVTGRLKNKRFSFQLPDPQQLSVVNLNALDIQDIRVNGIDDIAIGAIDLEDLTLLKSQANDEKQQPVFQCKRLEVETVNVKALKAIDIGAISLQDIDVAVHRKQDGGLYLIDDLLASVQQQDKIEMPVVEEAAATEVAVAPSPTAIHIAKIGLVGDGHVRFDDLSVKPAFRQTLQLEKLQLTDLDTGNPDQPLRFELDSKIGKYAHISVDGNLKPLAPRLTMAVKSKIKSFELPPLSSYTAPALGYNLTAGTLNADSEINIDNGEIKGKNKLVINNIKVSPYDEKKMERLATQLSMPLDVALSTLRDKNNNIHLDLPVSGDISDPKFNIGDVINTAMGKAMKSAAMSYLKNSLQPFGALITIIQVAGDMASRVALDPIGFAPADAGLNDDAQQYLEKVAALMKERPELRIRICATATQSDLAALDARDTASEMKANEVTEATKEDEVPSLASDERLKILATGRAEAIKDHMVNQYAIVPERLFVCHPEFDQDAEARPQVKLLI